MLREFLRERFSQFSREVTSEVDRSLFVFADLARAKKEL